MLRARTLPRIFALLLPYLGALCLVLLRYDSLLPQSTHTVLINETDAETPGTDTAEFVELYDGGSGYTSLDGLVVVFFNGQDDRSYRTFDLSGFQTNAEGYFLLGNESVSGVDLAFADNVLQNGPDAIALYLGQGDDFPSGTAVSTSNLQDAVVYDTDDTDDPGLLVLLLAGEPQVDEDGRDLAEFHSNQRCPDGGGGGRQTTSYIQAVPTPKSGNNCPVIEDHAPSVASTFPTTGATNISPDANITITFSEPVMVSSGWYSIACSLSSAHSATVSGSGNSFTLNPATNFSYGENCAITVLAELVADVDTQDPPDQMAGDYSWSFSTENPPIANGILINEVDADTPGSDTAEFIELYDDGTGATALDGLVVVLFNGSDDVSYRAIDLDAQKTDAQGYFVIGNTAVANVDLLLPDGTLQNGADAIALYQSSEGDFPIGSSVSTANLLDAIVYDTDDEDDGGLLVLLNSGQPQVNESSRDNSSFDSNQRCPNASGGQRNTAAYLQNLPTPGTANKCTFDSPPQVVETWPANGQQNVGQDISPTVSFNEAVETSVDAFDLICSASGTHSLTISGGPIKFTLSPDSDFVAGENCTAMVDAAEVSDQDSDDPPDQMAGDYSWSFSIESIPVAAQMLINEVDADTAGTDTLEFIELFDGGGGGTRLDGLVIVLFNGLSDTSYRAIDLDGLKTSTSGYFVAGSKGVAGVDLVLPDGVIQNGADAAALYAASSADFPNGSPVTETGLLDALVYDTDDADDAGLIGLLKAGQPQVNEAARGYKDYDANQRCPNGQGGQRNSSGYIQNPATPKAANNCTVDLPPAVIGTTPTNGENDVALDSNLTIRFNEDVQTNGDWYEIDCSQSHTHTAAQSGGPGVFTLDPQANFESGEQCVVTIFASQIMDLDGLPQPMLDDYSWTFATGAPPFGDCGDPATPIHVIQGSAQSSALVGVQAVIAEGVVVGDFQGDEALGGFFLQEEVGEQDLDPQTSEGIFIEDEGFWAAIDTGETVRVQGTVSELDGLTSLTDLIGLRSCGAGSLPSPKVVMLPAPALGTWEQVEGMFISLPQNLSLTGSAQLGSDGIVDLALEGRLFYPTETAEPGPSALAVAELNSRSRIKLDDGSRQLYPLPLPPFLSPENSLRIGDHLPGVTGILADSAGGHRIQPTQPVSFARVNGRPLPPTPVTGFLRAAVFDFGEYFNGDGQGGGFPGTYGAATIEEFARQRDKIISALLSMQADITGLLGLENDGYGADSALQDLVNELNEAAPEGTTYAFIDPPFPELGSSAMTVGLVYRQERVIPLGTAVTTEEPPFDSSSIPLLVQGFRDTGNDESFVLALTQFPDRDQCPAAGDPNTDQNDGQACWNALRTLASGTLAKFLHEDPTGIDDADILVLGRLNAYTREDPLAAFHSVGYINIASRQTGLGYTSETNGESGTTIHALATPSLTYQIGGLMQWHINADEPAALDYRATNHPALYSTDFYRSSQHDPLLIDMLLHPGGWPGTMHYLPVVLAARP